MGFVIITWNFAIVLLFLFLIIVIVYALCAKLCSDHFVRTRMRANGNFFWCGTTIENREWNWLHILWQLQPTRSRTCLKSSVNHECKWYKLLDVLKWNHLTKCQRTNTSLIFWFERKYPTLFSVVFLTNRARPGLFSGCILTNSDAVPLYPAGG